jgi:hypothetical protein
MAEFLTMVRGCNLIGGDETPLRDDSVFNVNTVVSKGMNAHADNF